MYIFNSLVSWRSENEPDFAGGWPLCEQREDRDLGCGMGSWLLWAESGLASHPLEDRDRDMRLAELQSVDTGARVVSVVTTVSPGPGVTSPVSS